MLASSTPFHEEVLGEEYPKIQSNVSRMKFKRPNLIFPFNGAHARSTHILVVKQNAVMNNMNHY